MKNLRIQIPWCLSILLLSVGVDKSHGNQLVEVMPVESAQVGVDYSTIVSVNARQFTAAPRVAGRLVFSKRRGDEVKIGDLLIKLEDPLLNNLCEQTSLSLNLIKSKLTLKQKEINRFQSLAASNALQQSTLDEKTNELENLKIEKRINSLKLQDCELKKSNLELTSSINGFVSKELVSVGQYLTAGAPALVLQSINDLELKAEVPSRLVRHFKKDMMFKVTQDNITVPVRLESVLPISENGLNVFTAYFRGDSAEQELFPGIPATLEFKAPHPGSILVPIDALLLKQNKTIVYKVDNKKLVEEVEIKIIESTHHHFISIGDLNPGDKVITRGANNLEPGQSVEIRVAVR